MSPTSCQTAPPRDNKKYEWAGVDSNHRSNLQQIYSLSPLATREPTHFIKLFPIKRKCRCSDSNRKPADYKSAALPIEPYRHCYVPHSPCMIPKRGRFVNSFLNFFPPRAAHKTVLFRLLNGRETPLRDADSIHRNSCPLPEITSS